MRKVLYGQIWIVELKPYPQQSLFMTSKHLNLNKVIEQLSNKINLLQQKPKQNHHFLRKIISPPFQYIFPKMQNKNFSQFGTSKNSFSQVQVQVYPNKNNPYSSIMHQFEFLKQLGSGSFGRVIKVRKGKSDKEVFAMKQIKMMQLNAKQKDNALNEVRLLASIDSPNIISYKSAFIEEFGSTLCILMEYADGGDLAGLIKKKNEKHHKFSENFIWQVAFDILKGLKILHANNIIHRDIKPANVFFVGGTAKIGDLNVSKVLDGKYASTQTGTPYYTSPQIWNNAKYDGRVDIWSTGCLLYELATLRPPFLAKDFPGLSRKVTLGYYDPIPSTYSKKLAELIKRCLNVRMGDRPTARELLRHQIFEQMENPGEGEIELLDTIRCPRVLRNLHLPQSKSVKRLVTLKEIEKEQEAREKDNHPRSMRKIASNKNLQPIPPTPLKYQKQEKENEKQVQNFKSPMQSPNGYVKLPRIASQKNILY